MDCNLKLIHHGALLPSMMLPCALTIEAYQLSFDPSGSSVFGEALSALLEKAGEVSTQKRHQSLEEVLVKSAKGAKGPKTSSQRSASSGNQQKPGWNCKGNMRFGSKSGGKAVPKGALNSVHGTGKTGDRP